MSRLLSFIVAAGLASISAGVLAADDGVEGVREQAKDTYNMDRKGCASLQDDERKNCLRRAKRQYDQATAEARRMEAAQKEEKAAERAAARDKKRRARVDRDEDRSYGSGSGASKRPAAGAQSGAPSSAVPEPGKGMGKAPETAGGSPSN